MSVKSQELADALLARVGEYLPAKGMTLVREALDYATEKHAGQMRRSGDPVITHPLSTAETVAWLQMDAGAVAGALLHDVQEDCSVPNEEIERRFGKEVAGLVEGVT